MKIVFRIAAFLTCAVLTGCAALGGGSKGDWSVSGQVATEGYLDLLTNDEPANEHPKVVWDVPGDNTDKITATLDLEYKKATRGDEGFFTALVNLDYFSGVGAGLYWDQKILNGDFSAEISFNRPTWQVGWPYIVLASSYDTGNWGLRVAAVNAYWSQAKLTEWVPLFFKREPNKNTWDYRNNEGYPLPALVIHDMNGYWQTWSDQIKIDICYLENNWDDYRDYYRASDIVARNWNRGRQTIGVSWRPDFLNGNLAAGIALTEIGVNGTDVVGNTGKSNNFTLQTDHDIDRHGAFERVVIGAKYDMGSMAFSAMFNTGNTGGSAWWFLNKDANDKDMEDGYFDLLGSNPYSAIRCETGFNLGARAQITEEISVNGDVEVIGFSDMEEQGMMAAGLNGTYSPGLLTASLAARFFYYLGSLPQEVYPAGGVFGVHPSVSYGVIPDVLDAALRVDFVSGFGDETISRFRFLKLNPKVLWTVNANARARTDVELGYIYRYDFNEFIKEATENSINLKLGFSF